MVGILIFISVTVVLSIFADFRLELEKQNQLLISQQNECSIEYHKNLCHEHRIPAIKELCREKELCMEQKIQGVNSKVSAKLVAEVIEEFFKPMSYKTMGFMALIIIGLIAFNEYLLRRSINLQVIK